MRLGKALASASSGPDPRRPPRICPAQHSKAPPGIAGLSQSRAKKGNGGFGRRSHLLRTSRATLPLNILRRANLLASQRVPANGQPPHLIPQRGIVVVRLEQVGDLNIVAATAERLAVQNAPQREAVPAKVPAQ
jgi:hypothetical protein